MKHLFGDVASMATGQSHCFLTNNEVDISTLQVDILSCGWFGARRTNLWFCWFSFEMLIVTEIVTLMALQGRAKI